MHGGWRRFSCLQCLIDGKSPSLSVCYNADMSTNTPIQSDVTPRTRTLSNGAVYDLDKGRIVANPGGGKHAITSDNAREMVKARIERKRAIVQAAAQDAVQSQRLNDKYGDAAWIAEVTQAQMILATTPDAGKASTIAAEWLVNNAGMGEKIAKDAEGGAAVTVSMSAAGLERLLVMLHADRQEADVIDAQLHE